MSSNDHVTWISLAIFKHLSFSVYTRFYEGLLQLNYSKYTWFYVFQYTIHKYEHFYFHLLGSHNIILIDYFCSKLKYISKIKYTQISLNIIRNHLIMQIEIMFKLGVILIITFLETNWMLKMFPSRKLIFEKATIFLNKFVNYINRNLKFINPIIRRLV